LAPVTMAPFCSSNAASDAKLGIGRVCMVSGIGRLSGQLPQQFRGKSTLTCLHRSLSLMAVEGQKQHILLVDDFPWAGFAADGSSVQPNLPQQLSLKQDTMAAKKQTRPAPSDALELFHPADSILVSRRLREAHRSAAAGLASYRPRRKYPDPCSYGHAARL
jgi:hypothetical protein